LVLGTVILALSAWCAGTKLGLPVLHQARATLFALFFGAVSLVSVRPHPGIAGALLRSAPLRFFGKYSYGLYVYHGLLTWYLQDVAAEQRLDAALGSPWAAMGALAAIGVIVSTGVAVLSYELFEKRFLALKRHFEVAQATAALS
jgi:peptidoglycan/LPS O-acetylase OafA/YrhL